MTRGQITEQGGSNPGPDQSGTSRVLSRRGSESSSRDSGSYGAAAAPARSAETPELEDTDETGNRDSSDNYPERSASEDSGPEASGPEASASEASGDESAYAGWVDLVDRIQQGQTDGMEELYQLFSRGIRFYLCRQLGPQELDDKVHDTFVVVVQAIRRGELREPERLMGFVRTIVRRQVAAHIDRVVHNRREQTELDSTVPVADPRGNPEETAIFRQRKLLIRRVLAELSERDCEILTRFYLHEQSQQEICDEMELTETQFRLLKSRAKARFGELGKKKLAHRNLQAIFMRTSAGVSH